MNIEKWIPDSVLYSAIGVNCVLVLFGTYMKSIELVLLSIFSIGCCILSIWSRTKQKNDKS